MITQKTITNEITKLNNDVKFIKGIMNNENIGISAMEGLFDIFNRYDVNSNTSTLPVDILTVKNKIEKKKDYLKYVVSQMNYVFNTKFKGE